MIRATHYTEPVQTRTQVEWGVYVHFEATKHTLAIKLFRRYLIITWVWTA